MVMMTNCFKIFVLTCTVCLHRPVFDTINMLATHRRGKRHLLELSKYIKCKEDAVVRELQKKYLHSEHSAKDTGPKTQPTHQKTVLSFQNQCLGYRCAEMKQRVNKSKRKPTLEIQPTVLSKAHTLQSTLQTDIKSVNATVRNYLKTMSRKSSLEKLVERSRENYGVDMKKDIITDTPTTSTSDMVKPNIVHPQSEVVPPSQNKMQDYELKLRMSGWIKDLSGNWIKDPNVEFDSDEDEIAPVPPTT